MVFPAPGGPDEQDIVATRGGDFQGPFGHRLAAHVGEVHTVCNCSRQEGPGIGADRLEWLNAGEMIGDLAQGTRTVDIESLDYSGLGRIGDRNDQPAKTGVPGRESNGYRPTHRPQVSLQTQLP